MNIAQGVVCLCCKKERKGGKNEARGSVKYPHNHDQWKGGWVGDKLLLLLWYGAHYYCWWAGTDNHYVIEAKTPDQGALMIQLEGTTDMIRDDRVRAKARPSMGFGPQ